MHRQPRRNIWTRSNIRKQVRQLAFRHTPVAERPLPPADKVSLGETPATYRVIATGGRSGNATLLKDISCDGNKLAPRVLILTNDALCARQDGTHCSFASLDLDIFDEVFVESIAPWWSNGAQSWVWKGADEPCTIPGFYVAPHAAACNALLKKRCDTKRTVTFIKTLLPSRRNQLRLSIVDPLNEETRTVEYTTENDTQLMDLSLWSHETRHEGLPIYVTHAVLPRNTFTVSRKAIFVPGENMHWFQGCNDFQRMQRGFFRLKWVEPVEKAVSIPVADIERLVSPYKADHFAYEAAIKDHEEALASSVALAMAHQQSIAQKETLRLEEATWREEEGKLFGQFRTTLPGQENRRKLAAYARYYPQEANLTLRRLEKNDSPLIPSNSKYEYTVKASTECTVSDMYVDEDGTFELES
ncbi:hypothetical protein AAVH_33496 [Aphelenchoides avenae]|nr:hypothetical protein AAVH_33496 [Aphelenchus avenae]